MKEGYTSACTVELGRGSPRIASRRGVGVCGPCNLNMESWMKSEDLYPVLSYIPDVLPPARPLPSRYMNFSLPSPLHRRRFSSFSPTSLALPIDKYPKTTVPKDLEAEIGFVAFAHQQRNSSFRYRPRSRRYLPQPSSTLDRFRRTQSTRGHPKPQLLTCWHSDHHFSLLLPTTNNGDLIHRHIAPLLTLPATRREIFWTPRRPPRTHGLDSPADSTFRHLSPIHLYYISS